MTRPSFIPRTGFLNWKWQLFLIVVAAVEFYVLARFCSVYHLGATIMLVFMSMVLGLMFMRWEGYACWNRILYLAQHKQPTIDEMKNGILIIVGGILMIFPGIVTSILGLLLFMAPIRWIVRKLFLRNMYFEIPKGMTTSFFYANASGNQTTTRSSDATSNQEDISQNEDLVTDDYQDDSYQEYDSDDYNSDRANVIDVVASPSSNATSSPQASDVEASSQESEICPETESHRDSN